MGGGLSRLRRTHAVVACALWLFAIVVAPAFHEAFHHADHTHAANGAVVTVHFGVVSHVHPDGTVHAHATGDAIRSSHPSTRAITNGAALLGDVPHVHDAAGLAHHAVALLQPAVAPHAPVAVARISWTLETVVDDLVDAREPLRQSARGPPLG